MKFQPVMVAAARRGRRWIIGGAAAAVGLAWVAGTVTGCKRGEPKPEPQTGAAAAAAPTTTRPVAMAPPPSSLPSTTPTAAAEAEPTSEPTASLLLIDGKYASFPRAMLRLSTPDGRVTARLYTDDPPSVLTGNAEVNAYDLVMPLPDIDDVADLSKGTWRYTAPNSERQDTPYGIFLNTAGKVLQPKDVQVRFEGESPRVTVVMEGQFWEYDLSKEDVPGTPPRIVAVAGRLDATVPKK